MQDNLTTQGDFPHTYREFVQKFFSDDACAAYLEQLRWPAGFCCPACQTIGMPWRQTRGRLVCSACRHQTSVTTGTILEKTRTPLTTWFEADMVADKCGYNSISLFNRFFKRIMDISPYEYRKQFQNKILT